jgi:hypothetical protein
MVKMEFHPVAEIFPLMSDAALDELAADIKANGLHEPVWTHEGKIIDGRNRYLACQRNGTEPKFREWEGRGDLIKFVVGLNLCRRHLSESQRAMIASKLATRPIGRTTLADARDKEADLQICRAAPTVAAAAELLNVGLGTVANAKRVRREGTPEVVAAVESGEISLHTAKQIVAEPKEQQVAALTARRDGMHRKPAASNSGITTNTRKLTGKRKAPEAIRGAIGTLVGLATGLDSFTVEDAAPTAEEAAQWEKDLAIVVAAINRFRRQLKEHAHV